VKAGPWRSAPVRRTGDWRDFSVAIPADPVLAAALEAFAELGYHGCGVKDIAGRAGLSVPGLYHHYPSKQDMLVRLIALGLEDRAWRLEAAEEEAGADPRDRLAALTDCTARATCHRWALAFVSTTEWRRLDEEHRDSLAEVRHGFVVAVERTLTDGYESGVFSPATELDALAVMSLAGAIQHWYRADRRP